MVTTNKLDGFELVPPFLVSNTSIYNLESITLNCFNFALLHIRYIRKDLVAVGKLSLNLTKISAESKLLVTSLTELMQKMVTGVSC